MGNTFNPAEWWRNLDSRDQVSLIGTGIGAVGAGLDARSRDKATQGSAASNLAVQGQNLDQRRAEAGLAALQMDPLAQQKSIYQTAAMRALAMQGPPRLTTHGLTNVADFTPAASRYLSDGAMANAVGDFEVARLRAAGGPARDLAGMGFERAAAAPQRRVNLMAESTAQADALRQQQTQQAINMALQQQQKKKGGGFMGFLKKALPIASMAIPFLGPGIGLGLMGAGLTTGLTAATGIAGGALNRDPLQMALAGANAYGAYRNSPRTPRGPVDSTMGY
jgi:hypothetical protein